MQSHIELVLKKCDTVGSSDYSEKPHAALEADRGAQESMCNARELFEGIIAGAEMPPWE